MQHLSMTLVNVAIILLTYEYTNIYETIIHTIEVLNWESIHNATPINDIGECCDYPAHRRGGGGYPPPPGGFSYITEKLRGAAPRNLA